jgi:hypothetical protein
MDKIDRQLYLIKGNLRKIKLKEKEWRKICEGDPGSKVRASDVLEKCVEINFELAKVFQSYCEIIEDVTRTSCIKEKEGKTHDASLSSASEMERETYIGEDLVEGRPSTSSQTPSLDLEIQLKILKEERQKALHNLAVLEELEEKKFVDVSDLEINLLPCINNQRKANISLDAVVKKVVRFRKPIRQIREIITANRLESEWQEEKMPSPPPPPPTPNKEINVIEEVRNTAG